MSRTNALRDVPIKDLGPGGQLVVRIKSFRNIDEKVRELLTLAHRDAFGPAIPGTPEIPLLGSPREIHAWVREHITYADEGEEILESARFTIRDGFGDCDAQSVVVCCLALRAGYHCAIATLGGTRDNPAHAAPLIYDGERDGARPRAFAWPWRSFEARGELKDGWSWCETTIAAEFGEHPITARDRLGIARPDLLGQDREP